MFISIYICNCPHNIIIVYFPCSDNGDPELTIISKKLLKQSNVTKTKSFSELRAVLESPRGALVLPGFIPFFTYAYHRIILDNDRRIRQELNDVLSLMMSIDKKAFQPYMQDLIGPWWVACCDVSSPTGASAAYHCLESAFPAKKRLDVLLYLAPSVLRYVDDKLGQSVETLSDLSSCSPEEAEERFERVTESCLVSLARLINTLPAVSNSQLAKPSPSSDGLSSSAVDKARGGYVYTYLDVLTDSFWKKLTSKRPCVRRGAYSVLSAAARHCPEVFARPTAAALPSSAASTLPRLHLVVLNSLTERLAANVPLMLHAFVLYTKAHSDIWREAEVVKAVASNTKALLGAQLEVTVPFLLPLLASIPLVLVAGTEQVSVLVETVITAACERIPPGDGPLWCVMCELISRLIAAQVKTRGATGGWVQELGSLFVWCFREASTRRRYARCCCSWVSVAAAQS